MVDKTKEKSEDDKLEIEIEQEQAPKGAKATAETEIEEEDDTPLEDRGRKPMPKEIVAELERDELDEYEGRVKQRMIQLKKVWHDERREKEREQREKDEAVAFAQRVLEENKRLKAGASKNEEALVNTYKSAAQLEMDAAKKMLKDAYEAGDADKLVEAQEKIAAAGYKLAQAAAFKPTLQAKETEVEVTHDAPQAPRLDPKTVAWQQRNTWWGTDPEMTASALGLHQKLEKQRGKGFVGTDEYWGEIDNTMRRRFPEYFEGTEDKADGGGKPVTRAETKPATVVAPASRSTSSKNRIVLKQSQIALAKKLGLTPEQYAREQMKLENN